MSRPEAQELLEVRRALPSEQHAALALQRQAFGPNIALPGEEPTGERQELRVAVAAGHVVSCLTLLLAKLSLYGAPVEAGGIRYVTTHPEEQNRGHAGALLRGTLADLAAQQVAAAVLFPFSFRYYRKFGFELGGNHCHVWCRPSSLPAFSERASCRRAGTADLPLLMALDRRRGENYSCFPQRSEARWRALCADPALTVTVLQNEAESLAGYAIIREERDRHGGRLLQVLDLAAVTAGGWRGLLGCLSQSGADSIEWNTSASAVAASGLLRSTAPLREGFKPRSIVTVRPMFQFRVVSLEAALRALAASLPSTLPAGETGGAIRLALRIQDELLPENRRPWTLHAADGRVELRPERPGDPYLEADIRVFSQLFCGYLSAEEALSQNLIRCSPAAFPAAARCFPERETFIPELDRF